MAEVSVSVIGKDMLSASFGTMRNTVAGLSSEILSLGNRAVSPVTIALGNLLSDVVKNGVNALNNLKGTIESFNFIKLNMEMEMTRSSFTTLLKSGDEANKMLETLRQYANFTPFEFTQLTAATKKMLAFGFSAKEITTDFMGIGTGLLDVVGNASSALGAGQEGIDRITRALGQMRGLARVSAEDMNQLIDVGVQGYQILAEQLGMTVKEVRDAMQKGALDAETGIKALLQGMMQQYGGGMASFSQTAEGMSSTLNDYLKDIQRTFGEVAYKEYRLLLTEINRLVSSPAFVKFAAMLGVQFGGAIKRLNEQILIPAIGRMTTFVNQLGETDEAMQKFFNDITAKIYPLAAFFRELGNALKTVIDISAQFIRALLATSDAQQAIQWMGRQLAKATEGLFDFANGTRVSGDAMTNFAERVVAALKPGAVAIVRFTPVLKELIMILMSIGKEMFQLNATQSIIRTIIDTYVNLASTFDSLVPRLRAFREAIPAMTQDLIAALAPARNTLSGFIDVLVSSGRFIKVFISELLGLRQTKEAIGSIPEALNSFADALRSLAARIDTLTARLPGFFDYLENLPNLIRSTIQSMFPLSNLVDQLKSYLAGLVDEAVQFVIKFTIIGRVLNTVNEVFKRVSTSLAPFVQFLMDMVRALLQAMGISTNARSFFDSLAAGVTAVLAAIARALPSYNQMLTVFQAIVNLVKAAFPVVISIIQEVVAVIVSLARQITGQLPAIKPIVMDIIDIIKTLAMTIIGLIPQITGIVSQITTTIKSIISGLEPFVGPIAAVVSKVISYIQDLVSMVLSNAGAIGNVAGTILGTVGRVIDEVFTLLPTIGSNIQSLLGSLMNVVDAVLPFKNLVVPAIEAFIRVMAIMSGGAIVGTLAVFASLGHHLDTIRKAFDMLVSAAAEAISIMSNFSAALAPTVAGLLPSLQNVIQFVLEFAKVFGDNLIPVINILAQTLTPVLDAVIRFGRALLPLTKALSEVTVAIIKFAAPFTNSALIAALDWLSRAAGSLTNFLLVVRDAINTGDFSTLGNMIGNFARTAAEGLSTLLGNLLSPENVTYALVTGKTVLIDFIIRTLSEILTGAINAVSQNLPQWVQNGSAYLRELVPLLIQSLKDSWNTLSSTIQLSGDGLANALGNLWNTIKSISGLEGDNVASMIGNLPNQIAAWWTENLPAIQDGMNSIMNAVINGYNTTWDWIKSNIGSREQFTQLSNDLSVSFQNFYRETVDKGYEMLGNFIGAITTFLTGPQLAAAMKKVQENLGWGAEELGFRIGVIITDLIETIIVNGRTAVLNFVQLILNEGPSLIAALLSFVESILATLNITILRAIQGLIEGILASLGLTDWIPAVSAFFDGLVRMISENSRMVQDILNNFANWWRSLELGTMLRNFIEFATNFASQVMPRILAIMGRIPELLINMTSVSIKTAMTDMITMLQNAVTAITDNIGLDSVSNYVRNSFQNIRDSINDLGGPIEAQMDFVRQFNEYVRDIGMQNQQLMQQYGFANASSTRAMSNTIERAATTISKATATVNKADLGEFAQNLSNSQGQMRNALVQISNTLSGEAVSLFTPVGTRIAQGVLDGFLLSMPAVESAMRNALDGISNNLSLSTGAAGPSSRGISSISTVNNKNVMLNLTVNQTAPQSLVENIRYAQALATSRIY